MSRYYDKELPVTVHVTYGGRHSGKTYREFEKLRTELKQLEEEHKELVDKINEIIDKINGGE